MNLKKFFTTALGLFGICIAMIISFVVAAGIANPGAASSSQSTGDRLSDRACDVTDHFLYSE
jgi:hypothetical protein